MIKKNMKNNKGITLVALTITIIVLLILAGVTIRTITEDGLVAKVQDVTKDHKIAQEKEEIMLLQNEWVMTKSITPELEQTFKGFMESKLLVSGKATSVEGLEDGPLTITMKSGNQYEVEKNTEPEYIDPEGSVVALEQLERYVYGADGEGRSIDDIIEVSETGIIFKQDPTDSTSIIHEKVKFVYIDEATYTIYIIYEGDAYAFGVNTESGETIKGSLVLADFDMDMYELANYILGPGVIYEKGNGVNGYIKEGRNVNELINSSDKTFKQDPADSTSTIHEKLEIIEEQPLTMQIKYNGKIYIVMHDSGMFVAVLDSMVSDN